MIDDLGNALHRPRRLHSFKMSSPSGCFLVPLLSPPSVFVTWASCLTPQTHHRHRPFPLHLPWVNLSRALDSPTRSWPRVGASCWTWSTACLVPGKNGIFKLSVILWTITDTIAPSVQIDIDLPQIAVIGSQSAGKSSLIESISGITLPRAAGTCTRYYLSPTLSPSRSMFMPLWATLAVPPNVDYHVQASPGSVLCPCVLLQM